MSERATVARQRPEASLRQLLLAAADVLRAAAMSITAPAETANPDAALIALGAARSAARAAVNRMDDFPASPASVEDDERANGRYRVILDAIEDTPAHTLDGLLVKVQAMAGCRDAEAFDDEDLPAQTSDKRLARQILNWLMAQHAGGANV